jgi:hypothetical protein
MGQIDVVVDMDLKPYDYLPIVPVVESAGGVITDWTGRRWGCNPAGTCSPPARRRCTLRCWSCYGVGRARTDPPETKGSQA